MLTSELRFVVDLYQTNQMFGIILLDPYLSSLLQDGWTPLLLALQNGHTKVVETLLASNPDVNTKDKVSIN